MPPHVLLILAAVLLAGAEPASLPAALSCGDSVLDDPAATQRRYRETVAAQGEGSEEARAVAAALGTHFSTVRRADSSAVWFRRARLPGPAVGPPDALHALALQGVGWALVRLGRVEAAEDTLRLAVESWQTVAGAGSDCEGIARERLANCLQAEARIPESMAEYERAIAILAHLGNDAPDLMRAHHGHANTLARQDRIADAIPEYRLVLESRTRNLDEDDPALSWICHDLALAYHTEGRFTEAESLYVRAAAGRRGRFPELYRQSADGVMACRLDRGDLRGAEEAVEEVLASFGPGDDDRASLALAYTRLGAIRLEEGDPDRAEAFFRTAIDTLGEDLTRYPRLESNASRNLAAIARTRGDLDEAERLRSRAAELLEEIYGRESVYAIEQEVERAGIAEARGDTAQAETLYRDAVERLRPRRMESGGHYGEAAVRWANVLRRRGRPDEALPLVEDARDALDATLPDGHILRVEAHAAASGIYLDLGRDADAWREAELAETQGRSQFLTTLPALTEAQALAYRDKVPRGLAVMLGTLERNPDPIRTEEAWAALASVRGIVANDMKRRRAAASDSTAAAVWAELVDARRALGRLLLGTPQGDVPPGPAGPSIAGQEARVRDLEERFARLTATPETAPAATFAPAALRDALGPESALVAYVLFRSGPGDAEADARYAAFVLGPGGAAPRLVPLGASETISRLTVELQDHLRCAPDSLRFEPWATEAVYRRIATSLRQALWDPVAAAPGRARRVYVVPDGDVWRINLAALPDDDGGYLAEGDIDIRLIGEELDLLAGPAPPPRPGCGIVGGVDYDACSGPGSGGGYEALPHSGEEAALVAGIWRGSAAGDTSVVLLEGGEATESAVSRMLEERGVIHVAVHGFLPRGAAAGMSDASRWSGLALAGANRGGCGSGEDGILTADEISLLDMTGVRLVVFSACASGLGDLLPREGVLGLQRALHVAGCRTAVLALWDLPDRPTRDLVGRFYEHYVKESSSPERALDEARTEFLRDRRSHGRSTHPFYWGGLVAVGASH